MTPATTAPQKFHGAPVSGSASPREMLQPANGRMSSEGMGIAALSMVIAITTPAYPNREYSASTSGSTIASIASSTVRMMAEGAGPLFSERSERMTALDDRLRDGVRAIGRADLLVGIPSFRNAATIGHVASSVSRGLREHFADANVALVNAD